MLLGEKADEAKSDEAKADDKKADDEKADDATTSVEKTDDGGDGGADDDGADEKSTAPVEPVDREVLVQAAREIMLYHLDRAWADHLAFVSDVRASIHLRAIGKESPLDEFHRLILAEFTDLPAQAVTSARKTFREAQITADGVDLGTADLHRSTTTWTYMVHDNLFASGGAKTLQGVIGIFR